MIVEVIGLPGAGKTTISAEIERQVLAAGGQAAGLRDVAFRRMQAKRREVRFIRNRPERASMFGAFSFRQKHAEVFETLSHGRDEELPTVLWNLELMAQYYFATDGGPGPGLLVVDEGFVHRGAAHLLERPPEEFDRFVAALPGDFALVYLALPVDEALARASTRRRGLNHMWPGRSEGDILRQMERVAAQIARAAALWRHRGCAVIEVDGTQPPDRVAAAAIQGLGGADAGFLGRAQAEGGRS
ncbi:MAG: hypothetical protein QNJ13_08825 [Paracoccaceae bacterium]|nr:hypothetical protein [Paracoccaceae bacterium]